MLSVDGKECDYGVPLPRNLDRMSGDLETARWAGDKLLALQPDFTINQYISLPFFKSISTVGRERSGCPEKDRAARALAACPLAVSLRPTTTSQAISAPVSATTPNAFPSRQPRRKRFAVFFRHRHCDNCYRNSPSATAGYLQPDDAISEATSDTRSSARSAS